MYQFLVTYSDGDKKTIEDKNLASALRRQREYVKKAQRGRSIYEVGPVSNH